MGLTTRNVPLGDPPTFMETLYRERLMTLSRHRAEYGFGVQSASCLRAVAR